jgi:hypothetical protein
MLDSKGQPSSCNNLSNCPRNCFSVSFYEDDKLPSRLISLIYFSTSQNLNKTGFFYIRDIFTYVSEHSLGKQLEHRSSPWKCRDTPAGWSACCPPTGIKLSTIQNVVFVQQWTGIYSPVQERCAKSRVPLSYPPPLLLYTITLPTASLLRNPYPILY